MPPKVRLVLLEVLTIRAHTDWANVRAGELLIDCEEDRTLQTVLVGMLREGDRSAHYAIRPRQGFESGVMNDPAISGNASLSGAIVADQAAAFEDFFRGQTQNLYAHLCLITGNRAEAEELAQDAFLKVWERWDRVADMEEPVGYLYRTAMNLFRKRYRRATLALRKTMSADVRRDEFTTAEDRSVVAQALVGLAPRQRAALVITELVGFSSEEAGRMLGVSPGTVRMLASQGRAAMKQHLEVDDV